VNARRLAPLIVAAAAFALAIGRPSADPDTFWHLASGRWMFDHRDILRVDEFSSTVAGQQYSVGEWLGEAVLYGAYLLGGWAGIALLRGILVATGAFFLTRAALRSGGRAAVGLVVVALALLLSTIVWTDRPHLFTLAFFPLLLDLLLAAREGRTRILFAVPPLLLVWTDLHGGYALGLALVGLFALEAVIRRCDARAFVAAAVAAALATLLDPGSLGIGAAFAHAASPPRFIVEELPPDVLTPAGFVFALFVVGTIATALLAGGELIDALVIVPLLWLGLSAQRDMPYFAMAAAPYLVRRAPDAIGSLGISVRARRLPRALLPGTLVGVLAVSIIGLASLPTAPDERAYPSGALAALRQGSGTLLNEYDWGGYLIWQLPQRPVFIDGRLFLYLPDVFGDWNAAVGLAPRWRDVLERYRVSSVLLRPDRPLVGALREDGWRESGAGSGWVLLTRP
jgi:cell shape-determining protein MreD